MLYWLTHYFSVYLHFFRVFQYLTFQAIVSALTSLLIVLFYCPRMIRRLIALQLGQVVRTDGPQSHLQKSGTPTMGGALILISVLISVLLWADLSNMYGIRAHYHKILLFLWCRLFYFSAHQIHHIRIQI